MSTYGVNVFTTKKCTEKYYLFIYLNNILLNSNILFICVIIQLLNVNHALSIVKTISVLCSFYQSVRGSKFKKLIFFVFS